MNIDNLNHLIETLRNPPAESHMGFNMRDWFVPAHEGPSHVDYECNSVACIAGWCAYIAKADLSESDIPEVAMNWLEITVEQSCELFTPQAVEDYEAVTIEDAIRVIEHLRDTGEVDWSIALEPRS